MIYIDNLLEIPNISKDNEIWNWSNPIQVRKMANKYLGKDIPIYLSTKKDKKYMLQNPETNKWVHFGQLFSEDYTKHQDEERRNRFLKRNARWKNQPKFTASFLSYWLLW